MPPPLSLPEQLALLTPENRSLALATLTPRQLKDLEHCWELQARPDQLPPPGDWLVWFIKAGRHWGKTRTGAEWVKSEVDKATNAGKPIVVALVGATANDVINTMINGGTADKPSGLATLYAHLPKEEQPHIIYNKRRIEWPDGSYAVWFSDEEPDQIAGLHANIAWVDEFGLFAHMQKTWEQIQFVVTVGELPRIVVTTTPRSIPFLRDLLTTKDFSLHLTEGTLYDNRANLSPAVITKLERLYKGTRWGEQELQGRLLDDLQGALFSQAWFKNLSPNKVLTKEDDSKEIVSLLKKVVVSIDPAITSHKDSDETGIIVFGLDNEGRGYVLADLSGKYTPDQWARIALDARVEYKAFKIICEANIGGDLLESVLRSVDPSVPYEKVIAHKGKAERAMPIAALFEQGRIFFDPDYRDGFKTLQDQMLSYEPNGPRGKSPDRLDALVWSCTYLFPHLAPSPRGIIKNRIGWF